MDTVKLNSEKALILQPQEIAYILDILANCPWKNSNPIISNIMRQLKTQESVSEVNEGGSNTS